MNYQSKCVLRIEEIQEICKNALREFFNEKYAKSGIKEFIEIVNLTDITEGLFTHFELKKGTYDQGIGEENEGFVLDIDLSKRKMIVETSKIEDSFQIAGTQDKNIFCDYSKQEQTRIIRDCISKEMIRLIKYILSSALVSNPLISSEEISEDFFKIILGSDYRPNCKLIDKLDEKKQSFKDLIVDCIEKYGPVAKQTGKNIHLYDYDERNVSFANEIIDLIKVIDSKGGERLGLGKDKNQKEQNIEFEISIDPQNLLLLLNLDDFAELRINKERGDILNKYFQGKIYHVPCLQKGYVRLLDKRALKMRICVKDFSHKNIDSNNDGYKVSYNFYVSIFQNFVGCLFVPKNNFKGI